MPFCRGSQRQTDGRPSAASKMKSLVTCLANRRMFLFVPTFIAASIERPVALCVPYT